MMDVHSSCRYHALAITMNIGDGDVMDAKGMRMERM
jgi:hypothetical protein